MTNQIVELQSDLFQELSDADSIAVIGGAGTVSSTAEGVIAGAGQTLGPGVQTPLNAINAANNSFNGYLANITAPTLDQVPA